MSYNPNRIADLVNRIADLVNRILFGTEHGVVSAKHIAGAHRELNEQAQQHGGLSTLLELLHQFDLHRQETVPIHNLIAAYERLEAHGKQLGLRIECPYWLHPARTAARIPVHEKYVFIQTADGFEFMTNLCLPKGEMRFRRVIIPAPDFDPSPAQYKPLPTRQYEYVGVKYRTHGDAFVVRVFREVRP